MVKEGIIVGSGDYYKPIACGRSIGRIEIDRAHAMIGNMFREPKINDLVITRMPDFEEPFIDHKADIFNHKKHILTCAKNRAKRKKRNRK